MMSNIYYRVHFMVSESYENNIINIRSPLLDLVDKIRKETLDESSR